MTFHRHARKQQTHPELPPLSMEHLVHPAMYGFFLISASMFWFGWTSKVSVHWISSEIATAVFGVGVMGLTVPLLQYSKYYSLLGRMWTLIEHSVLHTYGPLYGASAIGANNLLRYAAGGVAPLYTRQMYAGLGIDVSLFRARFIVAPFLTCVMCWR